MRGPRAPSIPARHGFGSSTRSALRLGQATVLVAGAAVLMVASLIGGRAIGGLTPSNYSVRTREIVPRIRGVEFESVDLGTRLEIRNHSGRELVVLGYDNEPYLRVGPRGIFENVRSPAVFLNASRIPSEGPPKSADPSAPPEWRHVADGDTVRWHDHRAHWMASGAPPIAQRDPGHSHVLQKWTIVLTQGDRRIVVRGDLRWLPPVSPWPYLLVACAAAASILWAVRTRHATRALTLALVMLLVAEAAFVAGGWGGTTMSGPTKFGASGYAIGCLAFGTCALVSLRRRGFTAAAPLVFVAGVFGLSGALHDLAVLSHSQVANSLPAPLARLAIVWALGIGAGLAVTAAARLDRSWVGTRARRRHPPTDRPHERARALTPTGRLGDA